MELKSDGFVGVVLSMEGGGAQQNKQQLEQQSDKGGCSLLQHRYLDEFDGIYDRPLACFGCGIGWACFILGFGFPLLWYIATALYFGKYHLKDPRERAGLAASAIAALICSVAALITLVAVHL